jgi:hypothetical protein
MCTLMCIETVARATTPVDFFEVVKVTPSRLIKHEVQSKSPFDNDQIETVLAGPQFFSHGVGFKHQAIQEPRPYLNWYEIEEPPKEPRRTVVVRDPLRGNDTHSVTIESSAFLLSPAQRLTTGSPTSIPAGLNYFKAYRILDAPLFSKKVNLNGTLGPENRMATRAILLCVPIEQWHHDDHFRVKSSQDCLVVYELLPQKHSVRITTIDQFGLNELNAHSSNWLCVRATTSELEPRKPK